MVNPNPGRDAGVGEGIDRTLVIGIILVVLLIIGTAILSAYNVHRLRADSRLVAHTHEVISSLEAVIETVRDAESGQRGYIITGNRDLFRPYEEAPLLAEDHVKRIEELTRDNHDQQAEIPKLRQLIKARLGTLFANLKLREDEGFDAASESIATNRGKEQMDALRKHISAMQAAEESLLIDRSRQTADMYVITLLSILLGTVLGLLAIAAFGWTLYRNWLVKLRSTLR